MKTWGQKVKEGYLCKGVWKLDFPKEAAECFLVLKDMSAFLGFDDLTSTQSLRKVGSFGKI
jgi:hypothetical protein